MQPPSLDDIYAALPRIRTHFAPTLLADSPVLSERLGRAIACKWDSKLRTGSFKERGAANVLGKRQESPTPGARGVCAASAGNHALALSYYAQKYKTPCTLVMPATAPLVKVQSARATGATVILHGASLEEATIEAKKIASSESLEFVSPYDHPDVIAGQGTAGLELLEQMGDRFDSVVIPVGGGGYAAGIAMALKSKRPDLFILGVQSEFALHGQTREAGISVASLADGIAVKKIGSLTRPLIERYVDSLCAVSECQIATGIALLIECERAVTEGAGAAGIAALAAGLLPDRYGSPVVMVCGSNIDMQVVSRLIERRMAEAGRLLRLTVAVPDRPGALHHATGLIAADGANVLQVMHDRSFSREPNHVDISFLLEVRDPAHKSSVINGLQKAGLVVRAQE